MGSSRRYETKQRKTRIGADTTIKTDTKVVNSSGNKVPARKRKDEKPIRKCKNKSRKAEEKRYIKNTSSRSSASRRPQKCDKSHESFTGGFKPARIVDGYKKNGKIVFQMQGVGTNETFLISSDEAKLKYPQLVLDFYQERTFWHNIASTSSANLKDVGEKVESPKIVMQWVGIDEMDVVRTKETDIQGPHLVLEFYDERSFLQARP